jgi:hypothetical protein
MLVKGGIQNASGRLKLAREFADEKITGCDERDGAERDCGREDENWLHGFAPIKVVSVQSGLLAVSCGIGYYSTTSPMIEEFKKLSDDELLQKADECFADIENAVYGMEVHTAKLLRAQFYMNEVDRRDNTRIARRDFRLELIVILLIGAEIVLGLVEGNKQAVILDRMDRSTAATATSAQLQADRLSTLSEEQKTSLASLSLMNDKLQTNLRENSTMATALQKQLKILQDEQSVRLAEQSKKPKLEVYVGQVPLNSFGGISIPTVEKTPTKMVWNVTVRNSGTGPANKGLIRIIAYGKDVTVDCSVPHYPIPDNDPDRVQNTIGVPFDVMRPKATLAMTVTTNYPVGHAPFTLIFNVDADEIDVATLLGAINVTPPKD